MMLYAALFWPIVAIAPFPSPANGQQLGSSQQPLRGGEVITGAAGLVKIDIPDLIGAVTGHCTGSMIAPNAVMTAAHCMDLVGARTRAGGNASFVISYFHPVTGLRDVFRGRAGWFVASSYKGAGGPGGANSDVGLIVIPGRFSDTDYRDYLRIYADDGRFLNTWLTAYGAGKHTYSGKWDERLRTARFEVENVTKNHIVIDTRKYTGVCLGDSGGPLIFAIKASVYDVPAIAAVASSGDIDSSGNCTNNTPWRDDAFYGRTTWEKLAPLMSAAGISCPLFSQASQNYRRCFDIPFIEEVGWEGYDRNIAVAIFTASLT